MTPILQEQGIAKTISEQKQHLAVLKNKAPLSKNDEVDLVMIRFELSAIYEDEVIPKNIKISIQNLLAWVDQLETRLKNEQKQSTSVHDEDILLGRVQSSDEEDEDRYSGRSTSLHTMLKNKIKKAGEISEDEEDSDDEKTKRQEIPDIQRPIKIKPTPARILNSHSQKHIVPPKSTLASKFISSPESALSPVPVKVIPQEAPTPIPLSQTPSTLTPSPSETPSPAPSSAATLRTSPAPSSVTQETASSSAAMSPLWPALALSSFNKIGAQLVASSLASPLLPPYGAAIKSKHKYKQKCYMPYHQSPNKTKEIEDLEARATEPAAEPKRAAK